LAPAAYHRVVDGGDREARVRFGVRTTLAGMALLALAITSAVFVVVRFVFDMRAAVLLSAVTATCAVFLWYVYPRVRSNSRAR
jgi:hypothetical protein